MISPTSTVMDNLEDVENVTVVALITAPFLVIGDSLFRMPNPREVIHLGGPEAGRDYISYLYTSRRTAIRILS